jgi:hypothetical protein
MLYITPTRLEEGIVVGGGGSTLRAKTALTAIKSDNVEMIAIEYKFRKCLNLLKNDS